MEQRVNLLRREQTEGAPYRRIDGDWTSGVLLLCDHADNRIPGPYGTLGLSPEDINSPTTLALPAWWSTSRERLARRRCSRATHGS